MNGIIAIAWIAIVVIAVGSLVYICEKIFPPIINFISSFIKWHTPIDYRLNQYDEEDEL